MPAKGNALVLIQVQRALEAGGQPFRAFEVLSLGCYERQAYLNVAGRLTGKAKEQALARKEQEFRELILKAYRAEPLGGGSFALGRAGILPAAPGILPGAPATGGVRPAKDAARSPDVSGRMPETAGRIPALPEAHRSRGMGDSFFHGKQGNRLVVVGPINLPVGRLFVEEVITECRKRGASRVDVLAFEFEMGLFPAVLEEAKNKEGIVTRDVLTKQWTDWVDYWAVDFDYESRKETIKVERGSGVNVVHGYNTGQEPAQREIALPVADFEERWTGAYIFENEWQSFRTRQSRELELTSAPHTYAKPGRYTVAVKVIDIFGNDTMTLVRVTAG